MQRMRANGIRQVWFALALAAATISPLGAQAQPLTKAECATLAPTMSSMIDAVGKMVAMMDAAPYRPIASRAPNQAARDAIDQADATKTSAVAAMKSYIIALQDMAYQMQRCAR